MDFFGSPGSCLFGRMVAHSELVKMCLLTSPLLKRLVLDSRFQLSACRPRGSGGMEIMEPAITRRTNKQWNKGGGCPDCLRKRSKQGHSRGELWESGWTVPQVSWFNTPIFQVVTLRSREGKRLAHVIQDILGTELWTLPPRLNNFPALS